jgi:hypothetical protein
MLGDYSNVLTSSSGGDFLYIYPLALARLGREGEATEQPTHPLPKPESMSSGDRTRPIASRDAAEYHR